MRALVPPLRPRAARPLLGVALLGLAALAFGTACKNPTFQLENRDTRVAVVVDAPASANQEMSLPLLIYVGDRKAVDRAVSFGPGRTRWTAPLVYMNAGSPTVSVTLGGRAVGSAQVKVSGAMWVLVTLRGEAASIQAVDRDPNGLR